MGPTGLFVNPAPDAGGNPNKAAAYISWAAAKTGATGYLLRYSLDGAATTTRNLPATPTTTLLTGLPARSSLMVTVAARNGSTVSEPSALVTTVLPAVATSSESARYANAATYSDALNGQAVVVFKNGATVYTHYANGYANGVHGLASGTKSFNCALEILAETDGVLSLRDVVSGTLTDWSSDPLKRSISVQDLLSLQAGISGNPDYSTTNGQTEDSYQLAIADTSAYAPGRAFIYDSLAFQDFALYFQAKTGGVYHGNGQITGGTDPVAYLQAKLLTPIGINMLPKAWARDVKGHPEMNGGDGGAYLTATDWLKYGQLVLQGGTWKGRHLLDAAKLANCTGGYKNPAYGGYGLSWWLNAHTAGTYNPRIDRLPPDGSPAAGSDQIAPHAPLDMFMAGGQGKQRLYIIPSLGLVVLHYGPLSTAGEEAWSDDTFMGKILGTVP